jgi:hypothetical protein
MKNLCLPWIVVCATAISGFTKLAIAEPTLAELDGDRLLKETIFRRLAEYPELMIRFSAAGAAASNVDFEVGRTTSWFIEGQRYGADLIEAGLIFDTPRLADTGWDIIEWGFRRQEADGGFGNTGDAFHSTSFFVEAVARALLVAEQLDSPDADKRRSEFAPKLAAAAHWMLRPEVRQRGEKNNEPFAHRRWLVAAAWGLTGRLTDDDRLKAAAAESAREGIALQRADGVNPEKGGFDVSYQAVGLVFAARYFTVSDDVELKRSIARMLARGLDREKARIDAKGRLDTEGSTRITSETGRSGKAKKVDCNAVVLALVYGAELLDRRDDRLVAERVARQLNWIGNGR